MNNSINPYKIDVSQEILDDLKTRLKKSRFPDQISDTGWSYGIDVSYLKSFCDYWVNDYDWRKWEDKLNRFNQFTTEIDNQEIHFIHQRSPHENATPLLISHGWPGSIAEFLEIIDPLTNPEAHGGKAEDAFHVVSPSIPGYGFSGPTSKKQVDIVQIATWYAELMARLGYKQYVAQGGDWGAIIMSRLGRLDAEHMKGVHLNMPMTDLAVEHSMDGLTEKELADVSDTNALQTDGGSAYAMAQAAIPQSIGVGLNDSPAGLAAWVLEKFYNWTDCDGDLESAIDRDWLITNIMIYWVTETITSSVRLYYEVAHNPRNLDFSKKMEVPTGVARFPKEILRFPRTWLEHNYNIVHWSELDKGGHFAAMEQPELLVEDIRKFCAGLRQ